MSEQRQSCAPVEAPVQEDTSASTPAPSSPTSEDAPVCAVAFGETSADLDEGVRLIPSASESCESEDYEDSGDESFSAASDTVDSDVESVSTASAPSDQDEEEDISNFLIDGDLRTRVTEIINADKCEKHCVLGKAKDLESLLGSLDNMTKAERMASLNTLLALLMVAPTAERKRGKGVREKFLYFLPFVGQVCRPILALCYGVVPMTIQRCKTRIRSGSISVASHGNKQNKNAAKVDVVWLVKWFERFAGEVGEVVPVRVRMQKTVDGTIRKYYSSEKYTLLPAHFTWDAIYDEMHAFVESGLMVREPARSTMRKLLTLHCPTIRIRYPRSNVCDICSIYLSAMRGNNTTDKTEALGRHTESARQMRREYKRDKLATDGDHAVLVMDFSQNLTIPSVASTPSQWYFCSLLSVSCFGIFYENEGVQTNYLYDERTSGKGSDQINSMLDHFIGKLVDSGKKRLTVYANNCSGQNKNNFVIKFFLAQVHMGRLQHVDYKFFVKGHTKNSCDCGFGHIRKHVAGIDIWTMEHLVDAVGAAASNATTVHVPAEAHFFKDYKEALTELYKTLVGVQQFQLFSMDAGKPRVVSCRKSPESEVDDRDLRRKIDGILTPKEKVMRILTDHIEGLPPPAPNAEKIAQLYQSIRPYVPAEFSNDPLYAKPTAQQGEDAKANKQARRVHRAAMAVAAKKNQDQRGREEVEDDSESSPEKPTAATTTKKKKRKLVLHSPIEGQRTERHLRGNDGVLVATSGKLVENVANVL